MISRIDFDKMTGLVPAIVQDADNLTVLMLGYMSRQALERTIEDREVTFWSRTRSCLWKKGATSGNVLRVVSIDEDCDGDTLLILARPTGPVCHTGSSSCFPKRSRLKYSAVLNKLFDIIQDRKHNLPDNSYTAKLIKEGAARIAQKVGEEAVEVAIAAQFPDQQRIIEETGDLFFHTLVLLAEKGIELEQVYAELEKRMK